VTLDELKAAFPEFSGEQCHFSDCTHKEEPGCHDSRSGRPALRGVAETAGTLKSCLYRPQIEYCPLSTHELIRKRQLCWRVFGLVFPDVSALSFEKAGTRLLNRHIQRRAGHPAHRDHTAELP